MGDCAVDNTRPATGDATRPRHCRDLLMAWGLSAAVHFAILLSAVIFTWPAGDGSKGRDVERRVGIVHDDRTSAIEAGAGGLARPVTEAGELAVPSLAPASSIEPVGLAGEEFGQSSPVEPVIGVDLSAGTASLDSSGGAWGSLASGAGGQGGGGASFFGLEASGTKFVFVVDRSGSMKGSKLAAAKAELLRSVAALDRDAKFYTIFFNNEVEAMVGMKLVRATEVSKKSHFNWVSRVGAGGGTDPTEAMQLAVSLRPDAIWLLSDGMFKPSVVAAIRQANASGRVRIHTLAFYSRKGEAQLKKIAEENRGKYRYVSPAALGLGQR